MLKELDVIVLTNDVAADIDGEDLKAGAAGTIVDVIEPGKVFIVEFLGRDGNTVGLATVEASQVRPVVRYEIDHARGRKKVVWRDPTFVRGHPGKT